MDAETLQNFTSFEMEEQLKVIDEHAAKIIKVRLISSYFLRAALVTLIYTYIYIYIYLNFVEICEVYKIFYNLLFVYG